MSDPEFGFTQDEIDKSRAAILTTSQLSAYNFIPELTICNFSNEYGACRLNWLWKTVHRAGTADGVETYDTYFSSIPAAHSIHVPGPRRIMFVLLEDNSLFKTGYWAPPRYTSTTDEAEVVNIQIYEGPQQRDLNFPGLIRNMRPTIRNVFNIKNYAQSTLYICSVR